MKPRILLPLVALLLAQTASAQSLLMGRNIFPEGSFDVFGESRINPSGWSFPNQNDTPWQSGFRAEAVKGESGNKELKIVNPEAIGSTMVTAKFPLPAKIDRLRVGYRILPKEIIVGETDAGGNGAGIYVRFYDKDDKSLSGGWVGGQAKASDAEWQDRETIYNVPAAAAMIEIQVMFRSAKGEVRIDDIEAVPVAMSE